jgi:tetratricopeptide (TPR) repeat protein
MSRLLLGFACLALMLGCSPVEPPADNASRPADMGTSDNTPATKPDSVTPPAEGATEGIESLASKYEEAKNAFEQAKNNETKAAYVEATVKYGTAMMMSDLPPREKYPKALELYEEALKQDPNNAEAKTNRQLILDIYESMGRQPPKAKEE